jgi:hypothetical protein
MVPIVIESPKFCKAVSWFIEVDAITLFPFIICRDKSNLIMLNHEKIHIRQQLELLVFGFWIAYTLNWIINLIYFKFDFLKSYERIVFEKEAYWNEYDLEYLNTRDRYAWLKYFKEE